jgi:hypothetical protein
MRGDFDVPPGLLPISSVAQLDEELGRLHGQGAGKEVILTAGEAACKQQDPDRVGGGST